MTLEQKVDDLRTEVRRLTKLLSPNLPKPQWVRAKTVMVELGLTRQQIRYIREKNPSVARLKTSKQYEYNISELKNLAA